jgi:hypothetical protein
MHAGDTNTGQTSILALLRHAGRDECVLVDALAIADLQLRSSITLLLGVLGPSELIQISQGPHGRST